MSYRTVLSRYPLIVLSIKAINDLQPFVFSEDSDVLDQLFEYTSNFMIKNIPELTFENKECSCPKIDEKVSKKKKKTDNCLPTNETFMNIFYNTTMDTNFIFLNYGLLLNEFRVNLNEKLGLLPYQGSEAKKIKLEILNCKNQIIFSFSNFENVNCDAIKILSDERESFRRQISISDDLESESLDDSDEDESLESDDGTEDTESSSDSEDEDSESEFSSSDSEDED